MLAISTNQLTPVRLLSLSNSDIKLYKGMHVGTFHPLQSNIQDKLNANCISSMFPEDKDWKASLLDSNGLPAQQNEEVLQLLEDFKDVFSQSPTDYGRTTLIKHRIDTREARPTRQAPRRIPHALQEEIDKQIDSMLEHSIIQPS